MIPFFSLLSGTEVSLLGHFSLLSLLNSVDCILCILYAFWFFYEKQRAFGESSSESEKEDEDNGDVLCAWGHQKGRHSDLSSNLVNTSSSKPQDPSKSLPISIID
jgi:hypothetical protein